MMPLLLLAMKLALESEEKEYDAVCNVRIATEYEEYLSSDLIVHKCSAKNDLLTFMKDTIFKENYRSEHHDLVYHAQYWQPIIEFSQTVYPCESLVVFSPRMPTLF